jgi:hypothetical protein
VGIYQKYNNRASGKIISDPEKLDDLESGNSSDGRPKL